MVLIFRQKGPDGLILHYTQMVDTNRILINYTEDFKRVWDDGIVQYIKSEYNDKTRYPEPIDVYNNAYLKQFYCALNFYCFKDKANVLFNAVFSLKHPHVSSFFVASVWKTLNNVKIYNTYKPALEFNKNDLIFWMKYTTWVMFLLE